MNGTVIQISKYLNIPRRKVETAWRQAKRQAKLEGEKAQYLLIFKYTLTILRVKNIPKFPIGIGDTFSINLDGLQTVIVDQINPSHLRVKVIGDDEGFVIIPLICLLFIL